jgi:hypothetical protein
MTESNDLPLEVLLMQPKDKPKELLALLLKYFKRNKFIDKAYFSIGQFSNNLNGLDFVVAIKITRQEAIGEEISKVRLYLADTDFPSDNNRVVIVDQTQPPFLSYFTKQ